MFTKKNWHRALVFCLTALTSAVILQGCGAKSQEDYLAKMKEFSTPDKTASIYLDQNWSEEDLQMDCWLGAGSKKGDKAVVLMQFPKSGSNAMASSMDEVTSLLESSYNVSDKKETEAPSVSELSNVSAFTCKMTADGVTGGAYLVYGETDYAYYALSYIADKLTDGDMVSFKASCSKFHEEAPEIEDNFTSEMSDTIRWFNASYAILTKVNNWDYNLFGGLPANEDSAKTIQPLLTEWWDVTDRATADETLNWILTEGHRLDFAENMQTLESIGVTADTPTEELVTLLTDEYSFDEEEAQSYANAYTMYTEFGENAISGWDYCRAMNLLGYYFTAGYYTEQEALDKSLEIAQTMQPLFESWDDLVDSYLRGYEYWAGGDSQERRTVYEDLKAASDNPYAIDFKMNLEKTW
ncbi:MAG: DUF1266 domain-containing protein [Lachnospiraceae bacterium]|jgi:hypothetical protein|nr:DUF1266 domain-containing protein [Lachnospiraceae bacterium]